VKFTATVAVGGLAAAALAAGIAAARPQVDGGGAAPPPAPAAKDGESPDAGGRASFAARVGELASPDLAVREKAYLALRDAGAAAKSALVRGAKAADPQVRWAAQRLLRLLREGDGDGPGTFRLRFDDGESEDAGGVVDSPRVRPLPFGFDRADLEARIEELRRNAEALQERVRRELGALRFGAVPGVPGTPLPSAGGAVRIVADDGTLRREIEMEEGKVRVTLTSKDASGEETSESVEAASLDDLREKHPEAWAKVQDLLAGGSGGIRLRWEAPGATLPDLPRLRLFAGADADKRESTEARALLGVTVSAVPDVLRTQLAIPEGEGSVVEQVRERSLAERLGLRRHDVILAVNGLPVSEADDIRGAVGAVAKGEALRVKVLRGGKVQELEVVR
jgi:hypothetical protein